MEAEQAIEDGACEVDMVMTIPLFKSKLYGRVRSDVGAVVNASKRRGGAWKRSRGQGYG